VETPFRPCDPASAHPKYAERRINVASKTLKLLQLRWPPGTGYWEVKLLFAATDRSLRAWPDRQKRTARHFVEVLLVLSGIWLVGNSAGTGKCDHRHASKHVKKYTPKSRLTKYQYIQLYGNCKKN
jgi:hypothetical protein